MPPLRVCGQPGCPALTRDGYCPAHTREAPQEQRPTAAQRGYGAKWARYSKRYRQEHPYCIRCLERGRQTPTAAVDHIKPVTSPGDQGFWDVDNHQPLCLSCHAAKTAQEGRTQGTAEPSREWYFV